MGARVVARAVDPGRGDDYAASGHDRGGCLRLNALRLSAMKPSLQQMTSMLAEEPLQLTPGVADLIATMHSRGQHKVELHVYVRHVYYVCVYTHIITIMFIYLFRPSLLAWQVK